MQVLGPTNYLLSASPTSYVRVGAHYNIMGPYPSLAIIIVGERLLCDGRCHVVMCLHVLRDPALCHG